MKKFVKIFAITTTAIILLIYLALTLFLIINEQKLEKDIPHNESTVTRIKSQHRIQLIDDGLSSFKTRLDLIEKAEKSIELEFFIYDLDTAARLITDKLIKKAQSGVKVKLLVDFSFAVFKLRPLYANFLISQGIEVKYYNTTSNLRFISTQHRNHRKYLIVDDKFALTGGRNIANDYFNLSFEYNFLDSDILIEGPIVKNIRNSFELYWNSEFAVAPEETNDSPEELKKIISLLDQDRKILVDLMNMNDNLQKSIQKSDCNDISFITDYPGMAEGKRHVFKALTKVLSDAKTSVIAESPYFVIRNGGLALIQNLSKKNISLKVLSNGLYSTDAFYTISAFYLNTDQLLDTNLELYAYNGEAPEHFKSSMSPSSKRWGVHSKRAVIDNSTVIIGTYNIDPRSANLNSEAIIICHDGPKLAEQVSNSILKRIEKSSPVIQNHNFNSELLFNKSNFVQKMSFILALPLAYFFDFLL